MARDVFKQDIPVNKPKRNNFDLSYQNNLSFNFGQLVPVMCKEVIPGDTFHIDSAFGLRLMPMKFPLQTRMRAHLKFFYVRNRNIWKNWKKFLRNKGDSVTFPYISGTQEHMRKMFQNGTLADYLGCPTSVASAFDMPVASAPCVYWNTRSAWSSVSNTPPGNQFLWLGTKLFEDANWIAKQFQLTAYSIATASRALRSLGLTNLQILPGNTFVDIKISIQSNDSTLTSVPVARIVLLKVKDLEAFNNAVSENKILSILGNLLVIASSVERFTGVSNSENDSFDFVIPSGSKFYYNNKVSPIAIDDLQEDNIVPMLLFDSSGSYEKDVICSQAFTMSVEGVSQSVYSSDTNAYISGDLKVSALPFRAYESIYNAIYRNTQNDPFIKDGKENYDDFVTNDDDGADSTEYGIFQEYWEKDFLTTCLNSPQQGNAPLLGLSSSTAPGTVYNNSYIMRYTSEDGSTKDIRVLKNASGVLSFSASGVDSELQGDLEALNSASQYGISINDLRNVNSLQRWLEKAILNGYRYKDIIHAHFGIDIALRELDMPEFLGGISEDINVSAITQTSESGSTPQGWQVGQGGVFARNPHTISKYCDEHGFIMAILCVVPVPSYQQLLPKIFTKFGVLDYFSPEFAHIGLQPVKYKEVCPLQALNSNVSLDKVFGYNRAWYDYLASVDEIHGEFRDTLSDFVMTRKFAVQPELGSQFLKIDPEQTNDVFNVTAGDDHKIYGQVGFRITAERPIPLFNEPRLE